MSGSHHDGGSHSGSHHSGGGGGFSGGSGGFGGGHYSGGGFGSVDGEDGNYVSFEEFIQTVVLYVTIVLSFVGIGLANKIIGYNMLSMALVCASFIIYLVFTFDKCDYSSLQRLKNFPRPGNCRPVYNRVSPEGLEDDIKTDGQSWYSKKKFFIDFDERETKEENIKTVYDALLTWPGILKLTKWHFFFFSLAWALIALFFYEMIIPIFEHATMSDEAFNFIDDLIFYLPSVIALLSAITYIIVEKVRTNLLHKLCVKIVDNNISMKKIKKDEKTIETIKKTKWYFNQCPNCATESTGAVCLNCGSSLEILEDALSYDESARHKVI